MAKGYSNVTPFCPSSAGGSCGRPTAGHSSCHAERIQWSVRLCCVEAGEMEQPPWRMVDFNSDHRNIRKKTQKVISSAAIATLRTV